MKIFLKSKLSWIIIAVIVFIMIATLVNHSIYPLKVDEYGTNIETPDKNNLKIKEVTYRAIVKNKTNKPIDFKLNFNKNEKDREWYVYYDIIPDNYTSDICHLEPQELQVFEFKRTINYETSKTITSVYVNMKIDYEIIKK